MAHSRKHFLCIKDTSHSGSKKDKRFANRKTRYIPINEDDPYIANGKHYRRISETWKIHDHRFIHVWTRDEFEAYPYFSFHETYEDYLREWYKK